ncbi:unnamed protein product [Schistosoma mattheei]|uniref:Leucine-rich repeat-containing protein 51 n=1 Tax=Schistosoma mattheei TaxID=31246 RepID=A0AA85BGB1_9TREM|nr:unnamed protein product [Schistosoma mattheei]
MTELADKKCDETQLNERSGISQPLDYSFLNIKNVSDLTACCPRVIPSSNSVIKKDINEKWVTRTLKINNNQIEDISALPVVVHELFGDTSRLTWLDISCNNIPNIPNSFSSLKHLKIIYMHGNRIATLQEVIKLKQLPKLTKLTLHGNPIEKEKAYFHTVLSILPNLVTLDFTGISQADKQTAALVRRPGQSKH